MLKAAASSPNPKQSSQITHTNKGTSVWQVRAQTRTDSARSFDSHSSSTISSDAAGGNKPLPPPVALKPTLSRLNQPSEEQSPGTEEAEGEDPANKSFLGKVSVLITIFSDQHRCSSLPSNLFFLENSLSSLANKSILFRLFHPFFASNMKQQMGDQVTEHVCIRPTLLNSSIITRHPL